MRVPRLRFFDFVRAERASAFVVTDSGGSQEECFYLDLPCLVHRVRTERREGLGENVVLSGMRDDVLRDFLADPSLPPAPALPAESPSDVIVADLERRGFAARREHHGFRRGVRVRSGRRRLAHQAQARVLYDRAASCPPADDRRDRSFHGRSTIVLAVAAPEAELVAIDPYEEDWPRPSDLEQFEANLQRAGVREHVRHVRLVDGCARGITAPPASCTSTARTTPRRRRYPRLGCTRARADMLVHDSFSSLGVTLAQILSVLRRRFRYAGRPARSPSTASNQWRCRRSCAQRFAPGCLAAVVSAERPR